MQLEKLLITTGRMPDARKDKMSTSGVWLLNRFLRVATALANLLHPKNLLRLLLKSLSKVLHLLLRNRSNFPTFYTAKRI